MAIETTPLDVATATSLAESVLFRIVRGDDRNRPFGTPRNPRAPTIEEFNPRIADVPADDLGKLVVSRRHGILPELADTLRTVTNQELIRFRLDDPISAAEVADGLSLTGGHHRTHEIMRRATMERWLPRKSSGC